jgi:hypothetical protein
VHTAPTGIESNGIDTIANPAAGGSANALIALT